MRHNIEKIEKLKDLAKDFENEPLWTYSDVATWFKCSESKLRNAVSNKEILYTKIGGHVRFIPRVIKHWMLANTHVPDDSVL